MREEIMKDSDEDENEDKLDDIADKKKLTKKERIEKLIADRLNKSGKVVKEDIISKRKKSGDEEENEDGDNLSDLDEFNKGADGEEDDDGEDDEDGEDGEARRKKKLKLICSVHIL